MGTDYGGCILKREGAAHSFWTNPANGAVEAQWLLGADGAKSAVAEIFALGRNRRFLVGLEAEFAGVGGVDVRVLHTFLDRRLAPGYIGSVGPGQSPTACRRRIRPSHAASIRSIGSARMRSGARACGFTERSPRNSA